MNPERAAPTDRPAPASLPPVISYRIEMLDGLRGIAVALVVLFHVWQVSWIDYTKLLHSPVDVSCVPAIGFYGVDLFFFLSAFCLTLPYAAAWQSGEPPPTLRHYFRRRVAKIIPSYWLAIVLLLAFFPDPNIPNNTLWFHVSTHLLFVHNLFFQTANSVAGVFWSLATEVQFYVLFPCLLWAFRRSPLLTTCFLVCVALAARHVNHAQFAVDDDLILLAWRDMGILGRLDTFAAGMLAAYMFVVVKNSKHERYAPLFGILFVAAVVALLAQMQWCYAVSRWDMSLTTATMRGRLTLSATLFVLGLTGCLSPRPLQWLLANPATVFLSTISYNLYIWHQVLARWLLAQGLPASALPDPRTDPHWQFWYTLLAWAVSVAVATAITWGWEMPFLRGAFPWRQGRSRR